MSKGEKVSMKDTLVTLDGVEKRAEEHAKDRGINWETVKQRRSRGCNWEEAMSVGDKRRPMTVSRFRANHVNKKSARAGLTT